MMGPSLGTPWAHDGPKLGPPWAHDGPKLGPPIGPMMGPSLGPPWAHDAGCFANHCQTLRSQSGPSKAHVRHEMRSPVWADGAHLRPTMGTKESAAVTAVVTCLSCYMVTCCVCRCYSCRYMFVALQLLFHVVCVAVITVVTCLSLLQLLLQLLLHVCVCRSYPAM